MTEDALGRHIYDTMFTPGGTATFEGPWYRDDAVTVYQGDCLDTLKLLAPNSVDAVVTDPPYGLEFMGKTWDRLGDIGQASHNGFSDGTGFKSFRLASYNASANIKCQRCNKWQYDHIGRKCECGPDAIWPNVKAQQGRAMQDWHYAWATECLRVLKPGGHMLAFGGTRTSHRLACAIEDAGFEIRDNIAWISGSGFPKGSRVNRDERFCQCAASAHTNSHTSPGQQPDDHTHTEDGEAAAEHALQSARYAMPSALDFRDGYQTECDCGDALPHPATEADLASAPLPECVQAHSHSAAHADDPADESSRTLCRARRIDHPSSLDSVHRGHSLSAAPSHTSASTSPAGTYELHCRTQDKDHPSYNYANGFPRCTLCGKPNADGWNVALKPAFEPIVVARKPLEGTVAVNVLAHGVGALNIDGCRVATNETLGRAKAGWLKGGYVGGESPQWDSLGTTVEGGRWPPNVVLDEHQAAQLDEQAGTSVSRIGQPTNRTPGAATNFAMSLGGTTGYEDSGGASRFFPVFKYTAKAPGIERPTADGISHPTVKPLDLMRWLVRLVTPPHGVVLDPFAGTGTTGEAAIHEHMHAILIEREPSYLPLIVARLRKPMAVGFDFEEGA